MSSNFPQTRGDERPLSARDVDRGETHSSVARRMSTTQGMRAVRAPGLLSRAVAKVAPAPLSSLTVVGRLLLVEERRRMGTF